MVHVKKKKKNPKKRWPVQSTLPSLVSLGAGRFVDSSKIPQLLEKYLSISMLLHSKWWIFLFSFLPLRFHYLSISYLTVAATFVVEGNDTHSSSLAWRIPGAAEPGGLPSMGSHRVGHDWSNLAAAAAVLSLAGYVNKSNILVFTSSSLHIIGIVKYQSLNCFPFFVIH